LRAVSEYCWCNKKSRLESGTADVRRARVEPDHSPSGNIRFANVPGPRPHRDAQTNVLGRFTRKYGLAAGYVPMSITHSCAMPEASFA